MSGRLLIAEDNADMREFLQEVLEDAGYDTVPANDGREALAFIERASQMIDLVITDVQMPGVKGDELLAIMRARRAETPVIVITAFGSVEQAVEMVKKGAFQYLTKPFPIRRSAAPDRRGARTQRSAPRTCAAAA
jgi:DNA-binding NtrC family response regulator